MFTKNISTLLSATAAIGMLVSACAVALEIATPSTDPAAPKPLTEVLVEANEPLYVAPTLRDRIGRIWAPVLINGKGPFRLVLDTGANSSAILESVAKKLNVPIEESRTVLLRGATGSARVPYIMVDSMEVGELFLDRSRLPIVADVFGGAEGILGSSGLIDKRIFIDFKNDVIRIARSHRERRPMGYETVPLKFGVYQLPTFEVLIGNIKVKAILDTGAQQTLGNLALREAFSKRRSNESKHEIIGVTLDVAYGHAMLAPPIYFPGVTIRNAYISFGDTYIFEHWKLTREPAIIVGMDIVGLLGQVIIDYRTREMHIRSR